jgi:hypothetical protein
VYVQLSSFYELYSCQERLSKFTTGEANAHFPSQASSALPARIGRKDENRGFSNLLSSSHYRLSPQTRPRP